MEFNAGLLPATIDALRLFIRHWCQCWKYRNRTDELAFYECT